MKKKINYIEIIKKYKVVMLICLLALMIAIFVPISYISGRHKPTIFNNDDAKIISIKKLEKETGIKSYKLEAKEIKYPNNTDGFEAGTIILNSSFSSNTQIENLSISYMLTSNWDKDWEKNQYVKKGIANSNKQVNGIYNYTLAETTLFMNRLYPFNPSLPFIEVNNPTIYVEISLKNRGKDMKYYLEFKDSNYITSSTIVK